MEAPNKPLPGLAAKCGNNGMAPVDVAAAVLEEPEAIVMLMVVKVVMDEFGRLYSTEAVAGPGLGADDGYLLGTRVRRLEAGQGQKGSGS